MAWPSGGKLNAPKHRESSSCGCVGWAPLKGCSLPTANNGVGWMMKRADILFMSNVFTTLLAYSPQHMLLCVCMCKCAEVNR